MRTSIDKAEAPGQFWGIHHFTPPGSVIVLAEALTLELPKDKYVQVWSPNHKPTISERDQLRVYRWELAQRVPAPKPTDQGEDAAPAAPKDPDQTADGRNLPSVAWTTRNLGGRGAYQRKPGAAGGREAIGQRGNPGSAGSAYV